MAGKISATVYDDKGYDHDSKYSSFRRIFPFKNDYKRLFCTDLDWLEWRKGKPVAFVEITRTFGEKSVKKTIKDFFLRNNGFQAEAILYISGVLRIPAFVTIIDDPNPDKMDNYKKAIFYIYRLEPAPSWELWEPERNGIAKKFCVCKGGLKYLENFLAKL